MKKFLCILLTGIILFGGVIVCLNIEVTTRVGINYEWHTVRLPLYLKILDFFNRHYNYKALVKRITKDAKNDTERALKIFAWTDENISRTPKGFPIIDDHVWHIIVRGHGVDDQFSDVFTTLCNYAGIEAFYANVYPQDRTRKIIFSFLKIGGQWYAFDPYRGVYFKDAQGRLLDIGAMQAQNAYTIESRDEKLDIDYSIVIDNIAPIQEAGLQRPRIQSPLRRFLYEVKKRLKQK